jgi:creatinine amidohydrolase
LLLKIVLAPSELPPMKFYPRWHERNHASASNRRQRKLVGDVAKGLVRTSTENDLVGVGGSADGISAIEFIATERPSNFSRRPQEFERFEGRAVSMTKNASPAQRRRWVDLKTTEFAALPGDTVAVLPVAAVEQHGPHLPVSVDACINENLIDLAMAKAGSLSVLVLPMQAVGKSNEHLGFAGTLTLSAETAMRLWTEIGESVHRSGVRRMLILNSHGGQPQLADIVARDLRVRLGMFVATAAWWQLDELQNDFSAGELRHGIHGGALETSLMLHFRPDLVSMDLARNFVSLGETLEKEFRFLRPEGDGIAFGWQSQDLHEEGVCGDAARGDAALGARIADRVSDNLVQLLSEIARYPLERLRHRDLVPGRSSP